MFSNLEESIDYNDRAVKLCRHLKASYWLGLTLWQKGIFHLISRQLDVARESYSESLGLFRVLQENEGIGIAQSGLCMLEFIAGNYDRALELYSDALAAFMAIGDRPEEARTYSEMSWTCLAKGDTHSAMNFALKSIRAHQEIGSDRGIGLSLYVFAAIEAVKGRSKKAVEIAAAAEHYASQKGVAIERGANNHGELYLENAKKELSEQDIEEAEMTGIHYTIKDILHMVEERASLKPFESALIKKLEDAIESNLSGSSFGVVELSEAVAMSQIQLYRKLKALKNQSPSQFIREYRLHKGRELLMDTNETVSEIAYQVGFVDPNYFSRIFTKEFSVTPTEFRNS
jgi:AraC-like DNA-binding protein